jgi:hypothetical protein
MSQTLDKQRQAMHDAFFADRDQELLEFLDQVHLGEQQQRQDALQQAAGVKDPEVLARLERLGVGPSAMAAFALLPLVRLAWADTKVSQGEFAALLKSAEEDGIVYGTPSYRLLSRWLDERPSESMVEAWIAYAEALSRELDESSLEVLRQATIERAKRIAEASGGILGLGDRTSHDERNALLDLQRALTKQARA